MAIWREMSDEGAVTAGVHEFVGETTDQCWIGGGGPVAVDTAVKYWPDRYTDSPEGAGADVYDAPDIDVLVADEADDTKIQEGFRSSKNILVEQDPVLADNVPRFANVLGLITPVGVANLDSPVLSAYSLANAGNLLVVRQISSDIDEYTLYAWDAAVSSGADPPYVVTGDGGFWVAMAGKYQRRDRYVKGAFNLPLQTAARVARLNVSSAVESGSFDVPATIAQGDVLYGSTATQLAALVKDASATRYLSNQGTLNSPSWNQVNLANGVTGTLPPANGGTGQTAVFPAGAVLFGDGTNAAFDALNLFWDNANNWLGIGQTVPGARLHATQTSSGAQTVPLVVQNEATGAGTGSRIIFGNTTNIAAGADGRTDIITVRQSDGSNDFSIHNAPGGAATIALNLTIDGSTNTLAVDRLSVGSVPALAATAKIASYLASNHNSSRIWNSGVGNYVGVELVGEGSSANRVFGVLRATSSAGNVAVVEMISAGTMAIETALIAISGTAIRQSRTTGALGNFDFYLSEDDANDVIALNLMGLDSGTALQIYASVRGTIITPTAGAEDGNLLFQTVSGGTLATRVSIQPDGQVRIGTTTPSASYDTFAEAVLVYGAQNAGILNTGEFFTQTGYYLGANLAINSSRAGLFTNVTDSALTVQRVVSVGSGGLLIDTDGFTFTAGILTVPSGFILTAGNISAVNGNVQMNTAGNGLVIAEGSNATSGVATLVGGTIVVNTTKVAANSRIQLTSQADGGTPGWLRVTARTAGTSFTITSSSATDTSAVAWLIVSP